MNRVLLLLGLAMVWISYALDRPMFWALVAMTCFSVSVLLSTLDDEQVDHE